MFNIEQAIDAANQAMSSVLGRALTDIEILVLRGAWERDSYDQIAARNQYSTSYISQDIAPKLWKALSDATGEKIKKNSLREPLRRYWEKQIDSGINQPDHLKRDRIQHQHPGSFASPTSQSAAVALAAHPESSDLPYPTYIRRTDLEEQCLDTLIHHPGSLVRIKSPKLTGKTSLINFLISQLSNQGIHTVNLSLSMADRDRHFNSIDLFLRWFCFNVEQELDLDSQLDRYWNAEWLGSKVSCTTYFEKYLLAQDDTPVVLCLDDIDLLFPYPGLYEDFFGLLRSWHEKARSRPQWKKLRLILAHSTEAYIRLNINPSPFNVGLPVELAEFNTAQATTLAERVGLNYSPNDIEQLISLLGGHPYLLKTAFDYLKASPDETLAAFLNTAPTQSGIYRNHLQSIWNQLTQHSDLEAAFSSVITSSEPVSLPPTLAYQLQSMGLIKLAGNVAQVSCQLYLQYFLDNLQSHTESTSHLQSGDLL